LAVYAIGDVQGCLDELLWLLEQLRFDPASDRIWLVGDLVNRGPLSLKTLRFVRDLGEAAVAVLGNHDLALLALDAGVPLQRSFRRLAPVLAAPDREELMGWLRQRPLLHHDPALGYTLVHAGLLPQWDLELARRCAQEVQDMLDSEHYRAFLHHMYGDTPDRWSDELSGWGRLRLITNAFTRLRYCDASGRVDMRDKGPPGTQPKRLTPWFQVPGRRSSALNIVFGHWSALGLREERGVLALDTGCVWGGRLTAARLDEEAIRIYQLPCKEAAMRRR
jgi:bis(5'-nucleosyl)-tetraphosphatase (symmetrical)